MSALCLTEEQRKKIEENRQRALAKRAEKSSPIKQISGTQHPTAAQSGTQNTLKFDYSSAKLNQRTTFGKQKPAASGTLPCDKKNEPLVTQTLLGCDVGDLTHSTGHTTQIPAFSANTHSKSLSIQNKSNDESNVNQGQPHKVVPSSTTKGIPSNIHKTDIASSSEVKKCFGSAAQKLKGKCVLVSSDIFAVEIGYNAPLVEYFKRMATRRYDATTKKWSFKLEEYDRFMNGLDSFWPDIEIEGLPRCILKVFVVERINYEDEIPEADLSKVDKKLVQTLLPFQREGVNLAIRRKGKLLLADDMGLGKTLQAICIAGYYRTEWPLLVVTPSSVRFDWAQQICKWLPSVEPCDVNVVETGKTNATTGLVNILSYDLLSKKTKELQQKKFKIIIMDESHFLKNFKTVRTRAALPLLKNARRVLLLSGTPALSRPSELFCQIVAVCPDLFKFHEFGLRYCNAKQMPWGWDYSGSSSMAELQLLLEKKVMIRRQKKDVLSQLPSKTRQMVVLDPGSVAKHRDLKVASKLVVKAGKNGQERRGALLQYFHETCKAKLKPVRDYLLDLIEGGQKFLVFAHHKEMMDCIEDCIKREASNVEYIRIDGKTTSDQRNYFCSKFQTSESIRVAVLSITAANAGLNLSAANVVVFAELFWNPGILVQAEDRVHRIGQRDSVSVRYLVAKGTADDYIWPLIQGKLDVLNKAGLTKDDFSDAYTTRVSIQDHSQQSILEMFSSDFIDNSTPVSTSREIAAANTSMHTSEEEAKLGNVHNQGTTPKKSKSIPGSQRTPTKRSWTQASGSPTSVSPSKRQLSITKFFPGTPKKTRIEEEACVTTISDGTLSQSEQTSDGDSRNDMNDNQITQQGRDENNPETTISEEELNAMEAIDWDEMM